jgi:hypothetical protein
MAASFYPLASILAREKLSDVGESTEFDMRSITDYSKIKAGG